MSIITKWRRGKFPGHGPMVLPDCLARIEFDKPEIVIGLVESTKNGRDPVRSLSLNVQQDGVQAEIAIPAGLVDDLASAESWRRGERDDA